MILWFDKHIHVSSLWKVSAFLIQPLNSQRIFVKTSRKWSYKTKKLNLDFPFGKTLLRESGMTVEFGKRSASSICTDKIRKMVSENQTFGKILLFLRNCLKKCLWGVLQFRKDGERSFAQNRIGLFLFDFLSKKGPGQKSSIVSYAGNIIKWEYLNSIQLPWCRFIQISSLLWTKTLAMK
jgi:hypothetical protein